jgi:hypothetical protein
MSSREKESLMARVGNLMALLSLGVVVAGLGVGGCSHEGGPISLVPDDRPARADGLVERVRARLSGLKPGLSPEQVKRLLADLPLGPESPVVMSSSGGKTIRHVLAPGKYLELTYCPRNRLEAPPGPLIEARITE